MVERRVVKKVKIPEDWRRIMTSIQKEDTRVEKGPHESLCSVCTEDRIPSRKGSYLIKGIIIPFIYSAWFRVYLPSWAMVPLPGDWPPQLEHLFPQRPEIPEGNSFPFTVMITIPAINAFHPFPESSKHISPSLPEPSNDPDPGFFFNFIPED